MPVAVWPASTHGAAPKVTEVLNTFLPEARGVSVPVNEQPPVLPTIAPFPAMVRLMTEASSAVIVQAPVIKARFAAAL